MLAADYERMHALGLSSDLSLAVTAFLGPHAGAETPTAAHAAAASVDVDASVASFGAGLGAQIEEDEHCVVRACGANRTVLCFDLIDFWFQDAQSKVAPSGLRVKGSAGEHAGGGALLREVREAEGALALVPLVNTLRTLLLALLGEEDEWG